MSHTVTLGPAVTVAQPEGTAGRGGRRGRNARHVTTAGDNAGDVSTDAAAAGIKRGRTDADATLGLSATPAQDEQRKRVKESPVVPVVASVPVFSESETPTQHLRIARLVRPWREADLRDLLTAYGELEGVFTNMTKTYVVASFKHGGDQLAAAKAALHGMQWPPLHGQHLDVVYWGISHTEEAMEDAERRARAAALRDAPAPAPAAPVVAAAADVPVHAADAVVAPSDAVEPVKLTKAQRKAAAAAARAEAAAAQTASKPPIKLKGLLSTPASGPPLLQLQGAAERLRAGLLGLPAEPQPPLIMAAPSIVPRPASSTPASSIGEAWHTRACSEQTSYSVACTCAGVSDSMQRLFNATTTVPPLLWACMKDDVVIQTRRRALEEARAVVAAAAAAAAAALPAEAAYAPAPLRAGQEADYPYEERGMEDVRDARGTGGAPFYHAHEQDWRAPSASVPRLPDMRDGGGAYGYSNGGHAYAQQHQHVDAYQHAPEHGYRAPLPPQDSVAPDGHGYGGAGYAHRGGYRGR